MTPGSHHDVEYAVFGVFVAASLFTGLYFALGKCRSKPSARTVRSRSMADEEFLGGRSLGMLPLALSVLASMVTATGLLGFTSHFYAYGMHLLWGSIPVVVLLPFIAYVVIPMVRRLGVTSVYQYIRMRFGNQVGIAACVVYFFLTEIQGAVSIFAAAVAISTFFHMPLLYCSLAIGAAGTLYTALGGMRGVVWTDSVQGILILICPLTILGTIVYDSLHNATSSQLRPFSDIDMKPYFLQFDLDFTRDENVWSCAVGLLAGHAYRMGMDQMVVQRYASAKSLREAQRTAFLGSALLVISTALLSGVAMALVYWYRDCDPLLSGAIKNIEQIIPYYIKQRLSAFPGMTGLFLAGVVSATLSTVSSAINSLAASTFLDILSPFIVMNDRCSSITIKSIAFVFGALMTGLAIAVPYISSAVRLIMVVHSSTSGPFIGLFILALAFPWANGKGASVATALTLAFQAWAMTGRLLHGPRPVKMPSSLDRCPSEHFSANATLPILSEQEASTFFIYELSSFWSGLFSALATIVIGLVVSWLTGGGRNVKRHVPLTSDAFVRIWRKVYMLDDADLEDQELQRSKENPVHAFTIERATDDQLGFSRTKL
uniref:Sodium dependent multivitamin transporter n=1 Tax=Rhipicephalus appendiculatus TaxID=34631 RepID=A0A131YMV6_RHIAP